MPMSIRVLAFCFSVTRDYSFAWLHDHGDPLSEAAKPIKAKLREAFHSDEPMWQGMALEQGLAACQAAIGGLHLAVKVL
jgi:hypothetical protein